MKKCNQQCNIDQFFCEDNIMGLRCYECNKTFVEAEIENPTVKLLDEFLRKEAETDE